MCDSMYAGAKKTACGYNIFAKSSDRSPNEPQPLIFVPAADHAQGEKVKTTFIEVEQVSHNYAMILSKPSWIWGAEIGINEHGVILGNESVISRDMSEEGEALLGMDMVRLALERATTAEEAVRVIGELMERYGQGGNASFDGIFYYDNAYLIADSKECWHVETAGKHYWAARRATDDLYSISNYMSIEYPDLMHKDLVDHAVRSGYPVEEPFNYAKAYIHYDTLSTSGIFRRCCTEQQLHRPKHAFEIADMLIALRDHSCNDEWTGAAGCVCMHAKNPTPPINPRQSIDCETTNSMIAVLKPGDSFILSPGMSTTCMAPFQPFWFDAFSPNQVFHIDRQETAIASWIRREEINRAAIDGRIPVEEYRAEMKEMERAWINRAQTISRSDRQIFVNENALQAERFIDKWLNIAKKNPPQPRGDSAFQMWWKNKNAELGKDRRIAW